MLNNIRDILICFQHPHLGHPQQPPHAYTPTQSEYKGRQYALEPDSAPLVYEYGTKYIQQVLGSLIYYTRAINDNMRVSITPWKQGRKTNSDNDDKMQDNPGLRGYLTAYHYLLLR